MTCRCHDDDADVNRRLKVIELRTSISFDSSCSAKMSPRKPAGLLEWRLLQETVRSGHITSSEVAVSSLILALLHWQTSFQTTTDISIIRSGTWGLEINLCVGLFWATKALLVHGARLLGPVIKLPDRTDLMPGMWFRSRRLGLETHQRLVSVSSRQKITTSRSRLKTCPRRYFAQLNLKKILHRFSKFE